jgi:hypothetical protein
VWDVRNVSKILVAKSERKEPVARPRNRWENDVKTEHKVNGAGTA